MMAADWTKSSIMEAVSNDSPMSTSEATHTGQAMATMSVFPSTQHFIYNGVYQSMA